MRRSAADHQHPIGVALTAFALCCACWPVRAEPVIGQFELKTLESAPGEYEFQSQNAWSWGQPPRQYESDESDTIVFDENSVISERYALELEMGFTSYLKMRVGIEFEQERLDDPPTIAQADDFDELQLSDVGVEIIAILVPRHGDGTGLGVVAEFEGFVNHDEPNNLVLGPIVEFQSGSWFAAAVPMFVHAFGGNPPDGKQIDDKWDFAYAAQLMYRFADRWSLALEGYGTIERLDSTGRPSEAAQLFGDSDQHRLGSIVYYTYAFGGSPGRASGSTLLSAAGDEVERTSLTVGFGLLEGLNANTPDHTLKLSIEVQF
jgi:hypothetical protein